MSSEQRLGKYVLQQRLGHGGMGEVWIALDSQLQRQVAIKLLRADLLSHPEFVQRFTQEARLIASLRHPNIGQIHDFHVSHSEGSSAVQAYMVMDYIQGITLAEYIQQTSRRGLFPPAADIIYIFAHTSLAIDYAHKRSMIHRDIKPANILLDQRPPIDRPFGKPTLIDFGIARMQEVSGNTITNMLVGTPQYIAPEQVNSKAVPQSDLYSLGIILYEVATGITPFRGETALAVFMQHLQSMPPPPMLINPAISPAFSRVILKSIAKDPDDRFQNALEMTTALCEALNVAPPRQLQQAHEALINEMPSITSAQTLPTPGSLTPTANKTPARSQPLQTPPGPLSGLLHSPMPSISQSWPDVRLSPPIHQQVQQPEVSPVSPPPTPRRKQRRLIFLLVGIFLITLLGSTVGAFLIFSQNASASVGKLQFSSSGQVNGAYDQVKIDLTNIHTPQAGEVFYAWLESAKNEEAAPRWRLDFQQGGIHQLLQASNKSNLLRPDWILVVTLEKGNPQASTPIVANRLYYAKLNTNILSYDVMKCPGDSVNQPVCLA